MSSVASAPRHKNVVSRQTNVRRVITHNHRVLTSPARQTSPSPHRTLQPATPLLYFRSGDNLLFWRRSFFVATASIITIRDRLMRRTFIPNGRRLTFGARVTRRRFRRSCTQTFGPQRLAGENRAIRSIRPLRRSPRPHRLSDGRQVFYLDPRATRRLTSNRRTSRHRQCFNRKVDRPPPSSSRLPRFSRHDVFPRELNAPCNAHFGNPSAGDWRPNYKSGLGSREQNSMIFMEGGALGDAGRSIFIRCAPFSRGDDRCDV